MKKYFLLASIVSFAQLLFGQKIIPIASGDKKYEVLDMTSKGRVAWGGYEKIELNAARSQSNGEANTTAIVTAVGNNTGFEGKPYAAKLCSEATDGKKEDWYLPSKEEAAIIYLHKAKFNVEERGTIWTSTESSGTQAVSLYWYTGANYENQKVEPYHFVCIRKVN